MGYVELELNDSSTTLNGVFFDFTGYHAELKFSGKIEKVICLKTGKDCTEEFKKKYKQK